MKKIKLFAIAVAAMMATSSFAGGVVDLNTVKAENNWYSVENVGAVTNKGGSAFGTPDLTCEVPGKKTGSSNFTIQVFSATKELIFTAQSTSNRTLSAVKTGAEVACGTVLTKDEDFTVSGGSGDYVVPKNVCGNQFSLTFAEPIPANNYVNITLSGNADIVDVTFVDGADAAYPFVKSFTVAGVEAVVDTAAKTIVAELPYGTDRATAIENAEVVMGGTAKTYSIAGDVLTAIDSADVAKNIDYDLTGIVVSENPSTDATLKAITVDATELSGFAPDKYDYQMLASGLPVVAAQANDVTAIVDIEQATANPGTATITVTAQDGTTTLVYTVTFTSADKICGQLVKVTVASGKAGEITGNLPATADVSLSSSGKMDKGKYFGVTLTQGTFKAGDVFNVNTSTAAGQGILALYADKAMTTPVYEGEDYGVAGDNLMVLPAAADGLTTLYMARDGSDAINNWNGVISFIEVTRDCEPKLVAFSMAGVDAAIDQEQKTVTAVLPFGTELTDNDWDNAYTLNGAATDAEYDAGHTTLTVNGEDTAIVYTLNITISQTPSSNANLSEITVNGNAITDFRADSLTYAYELPNGTVDMPVIAAVAEDITAQVVVDEITALDQLVNIVVTAQDASTQTYTVQLSVASASKYLYEAVFSNGAKGAIDNDAAAIVVPYLDGTQVPTLVSDSVSAGASAAMSGEDKLIVTGSDMSTKEFSITFQALSAPSFVTDTITFDGSESYIYAFYGWDAEKGVKFSKAVNEESNMRITTGKTRIYMALPACYKVNLISGTGGARDIKVSINGGDPAAMKTAAANAGIDILLSTTEVNFVAIESAQTGGDGGFVKMVMTLDVPSGNEQIQGNVQENKFIYNGQFYMLNNGVLFNALGQELAK